MRRLISASLVLSLMLLMGRLAGFLREIQISSILGVSRDADFAVVMLTTPDLLVNLLLAGGLSAALIPEFGRLDRAARTRVFLTVSVMVAALFGVIAVLVAVFPRILLLAFAPGYAEIPPAEYATIFAVTALAIPLAGLVGVTSALLNAEGKFFVAGAGTLVFNATIILIFFLWSQPGQELMVLAIAIASAGLLRYASQLLAALPSLTIAPPPDRTTDYRRLARRFVQALSASTLVLFIPILLRAIMSLNGAGNIAAYNYATKLVELPLGIAITTIATVAFPALSRAVAARDPALEQDVFSSGLNRSLIVSICIAIPCLAFSPQLVSAVFGRGVMEPEDLRLIADLARLGFLTLPAIAISSMATALINARGQTGLLLKITIGVALLVPLLALPGIVLGDVRLSALALPVFHAIYAVTLAIATRHRIFMGSAWLGKGLACPLASTLVATAICLATWFLLGTESAMIGSGLAMASIVLSLALAGALPRFRKAFLR